MSAINKLIHYIWKKEELPYQWKESVIVPICRKDDATDCSNYRGISILLSSYKIISNSQYPSPYILEVIGDHYGGFRLNRSITDKIFCIRQILGEKKENNETVL
jgi:hypothetical protein